MKYRTPWNYDLVRVTFYGITHVARLYSGSAQVIAACGIPAGKGEVHQTNSVLACEAPAVDCMSCLVAEGTHVRN